jgi:hypothetical protein
MPNVPIQDSTWLQDYDGYYYDPVEQIRCRSCACGTPMNTRPGCIWIPAIVLSIGGTALSITTVLPALRRLRRLGRGVRRLLLISDEH